jgi:hypothetical protein
LLGALLERRTKGQPLCGTDSRVIETDLADLPHEITSDPDWPVKQSQGPVLILPRKAIQSIRYSFWQWGIFLQTADLEFRIEPPFFGRTRVLNWLREVGWGI